MKKTLLFLLSVFLFTNIMYAEDDILNLKSESAIILEESTNKILYEKNANTPMAPASMTKIMTMLLIEEALETGKIKLDDEVTISENAANMGGSQIYLEAGSKATVKELLTSIGIGSANDSAVAMAEKVGGTVDNFVNMMNEKAKELGALNTTFKNPHGLDEEGHLTTAKDMAIIASALVKYEDILNITSTYETTITHQNSKSIWLVNTNSLIRFYSGLDGLKTGFTDNALYCLTGTMKRNDMRIITVVMKAQTKEDRNTDTINMMEYAFSNFSKNTILKKGTKLGTTFIDNGKNRKVDYYLAKDVNVIVDKNTKDINYNYEIDLNNMRAPLKINDKIGELTLYFNGEHYEYDVIVNQDIEKSNFINRIVNYFKDIISGNVNIIKS